MLNTPREKPLPAARLKIIGFKSKGISELVKKRQINRRPGSQVISIPKAQFLQWRLNSAVHTVQLLLFRITRAGIFPRSSLFGAGQLGFWEFGGGGTVG